FNVPLGLHIKKGQGLDYDFLHLHYRSSAIYLPMGIEPIDLFRQMKNTQTDPFSGGRNFVNHISKREWNIVPITSPIETQLATCIGTGIAHKRHGGTGITIVNGGDAGTAEGEFASCLIWASRPKEELPILIIVMNNSWGISTSCASQHSETNISDRAKAFGIKSLTINGNDVEASTFAIREAMMYVRTERKPWLLEARVSRLYGHSSATGANYISTEVDCLTEFEKKLLDDNLITQTEINGMREKYNTEFIELVKKVKQEPMPDPKSIYDYTYSEQKGRYW
ncbi:MAG: thiamine pyrophosphate-dependent dehydrogenase E1 component subunit alpha, partial [Deltaproteobacteria bacterium]|nr:thiamine pyrophosphate-dependent dehydrogenase E1 component subunit alpha [Deltaproteobacteria bacterium]